MSKRRAATVQVSGLLAPDQWALFISSRSDRYPSSFSRIGVKKKETKTKIDDDIGGGGGGVMSNDREVSFRLLAHHTLVGKKGVINRR